MLLDLARTLDSALSPDVPYGIQLVFFDGEEAFGEWSSTDSIYGSRHLAAKWGQADLNRIELFVLLDLIGASHPRFVDWFPASSRQFKDIAALMKTLQKSGLLHQNDPSKSFFASNNMGNGGIEGEFFVQSRRVCCTSRETSLDRRPHPVLACRGSDCPSDCFPFPTILAHTQR